jgi:hypothetical protein
VTSVARRGGGVRWRSLVPYSAGRRPTRRGGGRWLGAAAYSAGWHEAGLGSVPDVDRRVVFVAALLRCPMLTGGDFGCAARWWGSVPDVAFGGEARSGGRWRGVAAY